MDTGDEPVVAGLRRDLTLHEYAGTVSQVSLLLKQRPPLWGQQFRRRSIGAMSTE